MLPNFMQHLNAALIRAAFENAAPIHAAFQDLAQFMQHFSFMVFGTAF